jgi:hypothetical protein
MYLMYVDESGDTGLVRSPTSYFALSGLVIHESKWRDFVMQITLMRRTFRTVYSLPIRTEIHAAEYIRKAPISGMAPHIRLAILRNFIDELAQMNYISITNVIVDKNSKIPPYDVFTNAWQALFQRFENTLKNGNFPGAFRNDSGIIFTDNTDGKKLTNLVRRMSAFNYIPNMAWVGHGSRNIPILRVIEDPHPKDSRSSYFIQAADTCAYFLLQRFKPNTFVRQSGARNYVDRLIPVLNRRASYNHPLGIVVL